MMRIETMGRQEGVRLYDSSESSIQIKNDMNCSDTYKMHVLISKAC
jgi:hypothetical protein